MSELVLNMIVAICLNDNSLAYRVQDYRVDCIEYYSNCVVDKGSKEEAVYECKNEVRE